MKLTALYLCRNEEEFLPLSIATILDQVDEVLIIDTQSNDRTPELMRDLAARHPAKVRLHFFNTKFDDACEFNCRNEAIALCKDSDWIMMLDADQLMSDGWLADVMPSMLNPACEGVRVRYEHWVGSFEYIHVSFYQKQHNPDLHPEVPLWQHVFFRNTPNLHVRAAADTCPQFRPQHHARADESVPNGRTWDRPGATVFHAGFVKRDMMRMSMYRIHRGDYGHEPERKEKLMWELADSGNPFKFIGAVHRVDYGQERVPSVLRLAFDHTYRLTLDKDGFIQKRTLIATGQNL